MTLNTDKKKKEKENWQADFIHAAIIIIVWILGGEYFKSGNSKYTGCIIRSILMEILNNIIHAKIFLNMLDKVG